MTKEEAIKKLQKQKAEYLDEWVDFSGVAEAFDMAIRALKNEQLEQNVGTCQQNVGEMSEKQTDGDLQKEIDFWHTKCTEYEQTIAKMAVELNDVKAILGSAEKTAEWISYTEECGWVHQCSNCLYSYEEETKYCPNCGARMGVEE